MTKRSRRKSEFREGRRKLGYTAEKERGGGYKTLRSQKAVYRKANPEGRVRSGQGLQPAGVNFYGVRQGGKGRTWEKEVKADRLTKKEPVVAKSMVQSIKPAGAKGGRKNHKLET